MFMVRYRLLHVACIYFIDDDDYPTCFKHVVGLFTLTALEPFKRATDGFSDKVEQIKFRFILPTGRLMQTFICSTYN